MFVSPLYRPFVRRWNIISAAIAFCILLTGATWAQFSTAQAQTPSTPSTPSTPAQPPQSQQQSGSQTPDAATPPQQQQQPNSSQQGTAQSNDQPEPEGHITKQQAKDLFRSVDEILGFVSGDTGLPMEHEVKRKLITREQVEKYVDKRMKDDKDEKRLEQARLVLQKFGLLPKNYDLHAEFVKLMAEQVAAYYRSAYTRA